MTREFSFGHLNEARLSDPMHFHAYQLQSHSSGHRLQLAKRLSTDTAGIAACLGLQTEAKLDMEVITRLIEQKISDRTRFDFQQAPPAVSVDPED
jgi:uncharacterized metal-binding protein